MNKFVNTAGALAILSAHAPAIAWEPTKPVEIVVAAGAGVASATKALGCPIHFSATPMQITRASADLIQ